MTVCETIFSKEEKNPLLNWNHNFRPTPKEDIIKNFKEQLAKVLGGIWDVKINGRLVTASKLSEKNNTVSYKLVVDFNSHYPREIYGRMYEASFLFQHLGEALLYL